MWCRVTIEKVLALLDNIPFLNGNMLTLRNQILERISTIFRMNENPALVLVVTAKLYLTCSLGDDGVVLRTARFKQLRNAWQTTGNVTGLGALRWDTRKHVTRVDISSTLNRQNSVHREQEAGIIAVRQFRDTAAAVLHNDSRTQFRTAGACPPVDNDTLGNARCFVHDFTDGHAINKILKRHRPVDFRQDRHRIGVPLGDTLATFDGIAIINTQARTVGQLVRGTLMAVFVENLNLYVTPHHHKNAGRVFNDIAIDDLHLTGMVGFQERCVNNLRRTTNMERTHRQLSTRLTNRLGSNNTNSLAHVDRRTTCKVTTITSRTNTITCFTSQARTDPHGLDIGILDNIDISLVEQCSPREQNFASGRMNNIIRVGPAQHTLAQ